MASVERLFLLCPLLGRSTIGGSTVLPSRMIPFLLYPFAKYSKAIALPPERHHSSRLQVGMTIFTLACSDGLA